MKYLLFILCMICLLSCKKEGANLSITKSFALIEDCSKEAITDSLAIAENLIGEWKLIATGCGECFIPETIPNGMLTFTKNKGTLDFAYKDLEIDDVQFTFDWRLKRLDAANEEGYKLEATPDTHIALNVDGFCQNYIYFNDADFDGLLMIFERQ